MHDEERHNLYARLLADAESGSVTCGTFLASLPPLDRSHLYIKLLYERLERKLKRVEELHTMADGHWTQTFYLLYLRTLGDIQNQPAYLELARRAPLQILLRERLIPHAIESILLGTAGLLDLYDAEDDHIAYLRREFDHYAAKYSLEPMEASSWVYQQVRPANHPVLRLAQAAAFFSRYASLFDQMLMCRTAEEVEDLFCVEADPYWNSRLKVDEEETSRHTPKRLGRFKAQIIGINLVAILQYAYGSYCGQEHLRDRAIALLEHLPPEDNRYMRIWRQAGLRPRDSFESQALLQLITEHCQQQGCASCCIAREIARRLRP